MSNPFKQANNLLQHCRQNPRMIINKEQTTEVSVATANDNIK